MKNSMSINMQKKKKIKQETLKNNNKTKHGKYICIINVTCVTALAKPQLPVPDSNKQKE